MHIRGLSIRIKVFLLMFAAIVLPSLFLSLTNISVTSDTLIELQRQSDLQSIRRLSGMLDQLDTAMRDSARLLSASPDIRRALVEHSDDAHAILMRYIPQLASVVDASLMDADTRFIGEAGLNRDRVNWYFGPSVRRTLSQSDVTWSAPFSIDVEFENRTYRVIAMVMPVYEDKELLGYVVLYMDTRCIKDALSYTNDDMYLLDDSDCVVASKHDIPFFSSLYDYNRIPYSTLLEDVSVVVHRDNAKQVVTTQFYAPMHLKLVLTTPYESIIAENRDFTFKQNMLAAVSLTFSLLAALVIMHAFTKPILSLKHVVDRATQGDQNARYASRSRDEIDELGLSFNHFLDVNRQLTEQRIEAQRSKRRLQLQLLQEQIRPHFLYNVLEMISSLIQCGMQNEAIAAIQALAGFYRISLSHGSEIIPIEQEMAMVSNYLSLQQLRYIEFLDYGVDTDPALMPLAIPKLSLQPLIENAIYHGLKPSGKKGLLKVTGRLDDAGFVHFEVYDNGAGIEPQKLRKLQDMLTEHGSIRQITEHFGMVNVIDRLRLYFGNDCALELDSVPGEYTCVCLRFPSSPFHADKDMVPSGRRKNP